MEVSYYFSVYVVKRFKELEAHKENIVTEISRIVGPYSNALSLLRTVPGFDSNLWA